MIIFGRTNTFYGFTLVDKNVLNIVDGVVKTFFFALLCRVCPADSQHTICIVATRPNTLLLVYLCFYLSIFWIVNYFLRVYHSYGQPFF